MRRRIAAFAALGTVLVLGVLTAVPAQAQQVHHFKSTFSTHYKSPAGALCDFNEKEVITVYDNIVVFGRPRNPEKVITYEEEDLTHINLDTGYRLTEVDHVVFQFRRADAQFKQLGVFWHLRNSDGKIVVVQAGLATFNTDTGELIKVTPNLNPDFAAVLCPALGGNPAT